LGLPSRATIWPMSDEFKTPVIALKTPLPLLFF
jgi:hypothetical protein